MHANDSRRGPVSPCFNEDCVSGQNQRRSTGGLLASGSVAERDGEDEALWLYVVVFDGSPIPFRVERAGVLFAEVAVN